MILHSFGLNCVAQVSVQAGSKRGALPNIDSPTFVFDGAQGTIRRRVVGHTEVIQKRNCGKSGGSALLKSVRHTCPLCPAAVSRIDRNTAAAKEIRECIESKIREHVDLTVNAEEDIVLRLKRAHKRIQKLNAQREAKLTNGAHTIDVAAITSGT
jgi:hypothetical protein